MFFRKDLPQTEGRRNAHPLIKTSPGCSSATKQLFFKDSSDLTEEGEEDVASAPPPAAAAAAGEDEVDDDLLHANAPLCAQRSHSDRDAQTGRQKVCE